MLQRLLTWTYAMLVVGCYSLGPKENWYDRQPSSAPYFYDYFSQKGHEEATVRKLAPGAKLSEAQIVSEMAGREIWYKSAPNGRFHTYIFSQKINAPIDWYKILNSKDR